MTCNSVGVVESPDKRRDRTTARTLVFTSAQSNTKLHEPFWNALQHYCEARDAELHVSRFTYNKGGLAGSGRKAGTAKAEDQQEVWFDSRIEPFVSDTSVQITPDLVWCGELNIIPTRVDPISGFTTYTRDASAIIPHVKMRLQSVPTMKHAPTKFVYTTGAVTLRNYIQRAAGQRADFHHVFGAVVVEVDARGQWWVRQLNAGPDGSFYDLDSHYTAEGADAQPHRVQAITHGDLHGYKLDHDIASAVFGCNGQGGIIDKLRPHEQFFHDTVDFMPRNHHNIKDNKFLYSMWRRGNDRVEGEFAFMGDFLSKQAYRPWCKSFVVVSNHDQAIETWLSNADALKDPPNLRTWLYLNLKAVDSVGFSPFCHLLEQYLTKPVTFLREDDSYCILDEIEVGLYGHLGPNGARGNPKNLRTVGKANTGHTHSAGIIEGIYTAGVYGTLDMGYNKGLSSWSHSMVVTYPNAKRAILTIKDGRAWRD